MKAGILALICLASLPDALALRITRNGSALALAAEEEDHPWQYEHVPPIETFKEVWTERYHSETHLQEPLPSNIRLVLGLMTIAVDKEYRQVVRRTWLRQAGVCYWRSAPREGCSVYVAFVIGKNGTGSRKVNLTDGELAEIHKEQGMLVLDTAENMDQGKSLLWFGTALEMFPWATHIGKIDMDTYPFLHKLLYRMNLDRECASQDGPYEYIGRPDKSCGVERCPTFNRVCPSKGCSSMQFASRGEVVPLGEKWGYLSGELYILSLPLVRQVRWNPFRKGNEDKQVARVIDFTARREGFCVTLRRPNAWYHATLASDASFANDF